MYTIVDMEKRALYQQTWRELANDKEMIFLAGPRQAGKTTLARLIASGFTNNIYCNWDIPGDRLRLLQNPAFFEEVVRRDTSPPLIILDEIHKYSDWKNYMKGVYDRFHADYRFLVSGSGRLDIYQKGGDSLAGRYLLFHLLPFTLAELGNRRRTFADFMAEPLSVSLDEAARLRETWAALANFSGFPEPFLTGKTPSYNRWSTTYAHQLIREDIRDLTDVKSISVMETLFHLLPSRVGNPASFAGLARDLGVSPVSVQNWLGLFERFFLTFSIGPWSARIARSILKERKVYLYDTPRIKDPGARFENMVALELLRAITSWNDLGLGQFSLHFIKNKDKQEVDFLLARDNEPLLLIEAKLSETTPSPALKKFQTDLAVPTVQLTQEGDGFRLLANGPSKILIAPAWAWLAGLP